MTSGYLKFSSNFVLSHWRCNPATFCTCIIHLFSPIPNPQTYICMEIYSHVLWVIFGRYSVAATIVVTINFFPPIFCLRDYLIKTHFVCIQCSFAQLTPSRNPPCKNTSCFNHLLLQFQRFKVERMYIYILVDFEPADIHKRTQK